MKKITQEHFNRLVRTKKIHGKWDAFMTWDGLDMFQLANAEDKAKNNLFKRINTNWTDLNRENQEQD